MKSYSSQRGATLIVVMIMLLAITVIGTLAIKKGLISLNVATISSNAVIYPSLILTILAVIFSPLIVI